MIKIRWRIKRSIAFLTDLHAGSPSAPWPEGMTAETDEGTRAIPPSEPQKILNGFLGEAEDTLDEFGVDTIFLLGDLVHGTNRKEGGRKTMTPDLDLQIDAATQLLTPLVKHRKIYAVSGSGYHDSWDVRSDRRVVATLDGKYLGFLANCPLKDTNRNIQVLHGVSSSAIYREMLMGRWKLFLDAAEGRGKLPFHIDMVIQGHWHFFGHIHEESGHMLQVPGWVDWTPWRGGLLNYAKMLPDIGFCILLIDHKDRMTVLPFLHKRPMVADALLPEA